MMPGAVRAKTVTVACATGGDTATGGTGDANCQRDTLPATQIDGLFFLSSGEDSLDDLASSLRERHFRGVSMHAMTRNVPPHTRPYLQSSRG